MGSQHERVACSGSQGNRCACERSALKAKQLALGKRAPYLCVSGRPRTPEKPEFEG